MVIRLGPRARGGGRTPLNRRSRALTDAPLGHEVFTELFDEPVAQLDGARHLTRRHRIAFDVHEHGLRGRVAFVRGDTRDACESCHGATDVEWQHARTGKARLNDCGQ